MELIGMLIIVIGFIFSIWLGLWVMFIGGIVQIIEAIKLTPVDAIEVALGILRFMGTGIVIWLSILFFSFVGIVFMNAKTVKTPRRRRF